MKRLKATRRRSPLPLPSLAAASLESEVIGHFAQLGRAIGAPKSVGAIYGCLFVSAHPLPFEEIVRIVQLSTGSVSQGLKVLRSLGAAHTVLIAGDRRDHYVAETRLRRLVVAFLRGSIERELVNGEERLQRLVERSAELPKKNGNQVLAERLKVLHRWHGQAHSVIPALVQLLGSSEATADSEP